MSTGRRRGHGEGSVYPHRTRRCRQCKAGVSVKEKIPLKAAKCAKCGSSDIAEIVRWRAAVDLGIVDGKRKRVTVNGRTEREAVAKRNDLQRQLDQGVEVDRTMTVEKWLTHWLDNLIPGRKGGLSP